MCMTSPTSCHVLTISNIAFRDELHTQVLTVWSKHGFHYMHCFSRWMLYERCKTVLSSCSETCLEDYSHNFLLVLSLFKPLIELAGRKGGGGVSGKQHREKDI